MKEQGEQGWNRRTSEQGGQAGHMLIRKQGWTNERGNKEDMDKRL